MKIHKIVNGHRWEKIAENISQITPPPPCTPLNNDENSLSQQRNHFFVAGVGVSLPFLEPHFLFNQHEQNLGLVVFELGNKGRFRELCYSNPRYEKINIFPQKLKHSNGSRKMLELSMKFYSLNAPVDDLLLHFFGDSPLSERHTHKIIPTIDIKCFDNLITKYKKLKRTSNAKRFGNINHEEKNNSWWMKARKHHSSKDDMFTIVCSYRINYESFFLNPSRIKEVEVFKVVKTQAH